MVVLLLRVGKVCKITKTYIYRVLLENKLSADAFLWTLVVVSGYLASWLERTSSLPLQVRRGAGWDPAVRVHHAADATQGESAAQAAEAMAFLEEAVGTGAP